MTERVRVLWLNHETIDQIEIDPGIELKNDLDIIQFEKSEFAVKDRTLAALNVYMMPPDTRMIRQSLGVVLDEKAKPILNEMSDGETFMVEVLKEHQDIHDLKRYRVVGDLIRRRD